LASTAPVAEDGRVKLLALILGLAIEHFATQLLHLREIRWFDGYFDWALERASKSKPPLDYVIVGGALVLPLIPVLWVSVTLMRTAVPWDLPYLAFAVLIVFFCLGPRDLGNEVDEYCGALDHGDTEAAGRLLRELCEAERPDQTQIEAVEEAVFVQATNRMFGVVFWFVALGPVGAWLYRLSDLLRRRAAFRSFRDDAPEAAAVEAIHGILAWLPVRLAGVGYALSGSFDDAFNGWRSYEPGPSEPFYRSNDKLIARIGKTAMTGFLEQPTNSSAAARNSMRLVNRTLFIWVTVIAFMTLFGWAV
jgi:AmpE protein